MTLSDSASPDDTSSRTLCIDIGGSHVKAVVAAPVAPLSVASRARIGFPGAVRNGMVRAAPT